MLSENCVSDGTNPREITAERVPSELSEDWSAAESSTAKKSIEEVKESTFKANSYSEVSRTTKEFFALDWDNATFKKTKALLGIVSSLA